jgi:hypothetical protein
MSEDTDDADETDAHEADAERDAPLSDLAREVRERRERREREGESQSEPDDDYFEKVEVSDIDSEAVWEALVEDDTETAHVGLGQAAEQPTADASSGADTTVDVGGEEHPTAEAGDGEDHLVSKREYCQRCPHFSDPPEMSCAHEGTRIVEVVDNATFRVRNCPMVTEGHEPPQFE